MIHHDWSLFYDIYNTITKHNRRQSHYLSSILNYFDIYFKWIKKSFFITSSASSLIIISILSLSEFITRSSSLSSLGEIKSMVIVNWIFHVSDCLRLFIMSLRYGLIISRYSSIDRVLFLSLLLLFTPLIDNFCYNLNICILLNHISK